MIRCSVDVHGLGAGVDQQDHPSPGIEPRERLFFDCSSSQHSSDRSTVAADPVFSFKRNTVQISSAISAVHVILRERAPKRSFGRRPKDLS